MTLDPLEPHKMPEKTVFFDKVLPAIFITLGIGTVVLIIFSIGVVAGFVQWN